MNTINSFRGEYRFLSNFYPATVYYDCIIYNTVEHAYQASKCANLGDRYRVAECATPGDAKRLSRTLDKRTDWDNIKLSVMYELVLQKFACHPHLSQKLLATGDCELIEGNTWNDTYWGVCRGVGENHLGKILMKVRDEIREAKIVNEED